MSAADAFKKLGKPALLEKLKNHLADGEHACCEEILECLSIQSGRALIEFFSDAETAKAKEIAAMCKKPELFIKTFLSAAGDLLKSNEIHVAGMPCRNCKWK
jgi:hypothetical protein